MDPEINAKEIRRVSDSSFTTGAFTVFALVGVGGCLFSLFDNPQRDFTNTQTAINKDAVKFLASPEFKKAVNEALENGNFDKAAELLATNPDAIKNIEAVAKLHTQLSEAAKKKLVEKYSKTAADLGTSVPAR